MSDPKFDAAGASTFEDAARQVLAYLGEHLPMDSWSVVRVGESARGTGGVGVAGVRSRTEARWLNSFCLEVVRGGGPRLIPDVASERAYHERRPARIAIGAYAGVPIYEPDGALFGALCGLDGDSRDPGFVHELRLLEMLSSLLNLALRAERERERVESMAADAAIAAETDGLTGLLNRRAWDRLIAVADERFSRLADPTVVVVLDLDRFKEVNDTLGHAAGDRQLKAVAGALRGAFRVEDPLARIGGDEFGVILQSCPATVARTRIAALERRLAELGVDGSIGWSSARAPGGVAAATLRADRRMYAQKRARARLGGPPSRVAPREISIRRPLS